MQEKLINRTLLELQDLLSGDQLKKLKDVLTVECANYLITEQKNEVVIYDETSDVAAYKQFFVSKKIQGLSSGTLNIYMQTINLFMRSVRKPFSDVTTNDIIVFSENGIGVTSVKKAKKQNVTIGTRATVLESMVRSLNREVGKLYKLAPFWELNANEN
ncbi:hypothetical protein [Enterococcus casseliflavus]|uniref:hypothetical protein n=1 Tax=Enterococcus casseliflavus TaxID=37734 RepID=UPI0037CA51EE